MKSVIQEIEDRSELQWDEWREKVQCKELQKKEVVNVNTLATAWRVIIGSNLWNYRLFELTCNRSIV